MDTERLLDFSADEPPPGAHPWLPGFGPGTDLTIAEPDPRWARLGAELVARIRAALGEIALDVEHLGSTSVPDLPAKPIIDLVITVPDPDDEDSYVPGLVHLGLVHAVREPWWFGHRLFRGTDPVANVHVFGPDCPEVERMRILRDWLRSHPVDRARYATAKRAAAAGGGHVMDYNARKQQVLREILTAAVTQSAGSPRPE